MKLNTKMVYSESEVNFEIGIDESIKKSEENLTKLQQLSIMAQAHHPYLGNYFRLNIADGYVYYQTIEYDKKKDKYLCVRCKGICLDEWADGYIGESRWVDSDYVESNIHRRMALEKLFSGVK